ncbi:MAG: type II secretion system protein [Deltaproteobacteria bacterium]|nr:type II secretion system protein [Deltaproteobacteria bacterium]
MRFKLPVHRRRQRGYLLFEVLIGGAILAIVLGTSIDLLVSARRDATLASKRQEATALARAKAHELWGDPQVVSTQSIIDVGPAFPGLKWSWNVAQSGLQARSSPVLATNDTLHEITVRVEYPTARGRATAEFRSLKAKR